MIKQKIKDEYNKLTNTLRKLGFEESWIFRREKFDKKVFGNFEILEDGKIILEMLF